MKEKLQIFLESIIVLIITFSWAIGVSALMTLEYYLIGAILLILGLAGFATFMLVGL